MRKHRKLANKFKKYYLSLISVIINTTLGLGTRISDYFLKVYSLDDYSLKFKLEIKTYIIIILLRLNS